MTINTILFDCDNTLVLSEELAFEACADLINEICANHGIKTEQPFTGEVLIKEFVGQNFRGMMMGLQDKYNFKMEPSELEAYVTREEDAVIAKLNAALKPCPGVDEQLEIIDKAKNPDGSRKYLMAVVSSSALRRVKASVVKAGQDKYFGDRIYSAATSLPKPTSKPDPAIYLHALKDLGKTADECITIEDSKSGTLSGTRAGIKVVGYVGPYEEERRDEMRKVLTDAGAKVMMTDWSEFPEALKKLEGSA